MLKIGKAPMRTNVIISTPSRLDIILKGRHGGGNLSGFFVQCFKKKNHEPFDSSKCHGRGLKTTPEMFARRYINRTAQEKTFQTIPTVSEEGIEIKIEVYLDTTRLVQNTVIGKVFKSFRRLNNLNKLRFFERYFD